MPADEADQGRYLIEGIPGLVVDVTEGKTIEIVLDT